ncbi:hypothetical protein K0M31_009426 [Melipona bicolor]|uniref:Uncharacterized protein n=1 Tax=Melipona bicolor TaxID=60889 RepID=A0AA40FP00_9HYME|nr:hypothetical protein K0M31_009426 [Melipona bicolor]
MDPLHPRIDSRACLRPPSGSVSTEAGEKTKWVVQCRRNGREISVNYRVEPFRGWDECEPRWEPQACNTSSTSKRSKRGSISKPL